MFTRKLVYSRPVFTTEYSRQFSVYPMEKKHHVILPGLIIMLSSTFVYTDVGGWRQAEVMIYQGISFEIT
jgi:hypothetical protein